MIALFLALTTLYGNDQIDIYASTPSTIQLRATFSDYSKTIQKPLARFIIAEQPPTFSYEIGEPDSVVAGKAGKQDALNTSPLMIGEPLVIDDVRLYPISIHPSYLNQNSKIFYENISITLNYQQSSKQLELSSALTTALSGLILNYSQRGNVAPSGYLIITPDAWVNEITPLARWKEKKGWTVEVRTLSQTGNTAIDIKNYIADAYNTWTPRPEYVLLIGDVNYIPAASSSPSLTDHTYTLITGDDFFSEVLIGRLSASTASELSTMVAKVIGYETDPYLSSTAWFKRALMVGANQPGFMTTPLPTKRWVRDRLLDYGFNTVDTVFHPMPPSGITNSINQGVIFVNYRSGEGDPNGWPWPDFRNDDIYGLNNGWMLPVVISITCYTGHFGYGTCFGEAWLRAGSAGNPRGGVGFFGASTPSTHSRWNNCLDYGVYWAFVHDNIKSLGPALYRGKMEVFTNFPNDTSAASGSAFYFYSYNLLGDPSLSVWTDIPDSFVVTHASSVPVGSNSFSVQVNNSSSQPVEDAMVSLYKDSEVKEIQFTDALGYADFNFTTTTEDSLFITITKGNFKAYCGYSMVYNASVYVGHYSHIIDDASGNNNGEVNPGETIELSVTLKNYGNSTTATNVSAQLSIDDPCVTMTDSVQTYGNISPGATASSAPFVFDVATSARHDHVLKFDLEVTATQGNWLSSIWIDVKAPAFAYQWNQIQDGNGILEPGETRDMIVSIENTGGLIGSTVSGILRSFSSGVIVTDSFGFFGSIDVGDSSSNTSDHFTLAAATAISPGSEINFALLLTGDNSFEDTVGFQLTLGIVDSAEPLGPDDYGYYAYDDTDVGYLEKPDYSWVEIDPAHGGSGDTLSLENDETKTIALPFSFKFYGDWYNQVSISSNGYIAMGSTWVADMYNWPILAAGGPPLLIAPFWDDLDPNATDSSGSVCYWYDAANHLFVVEHSRIQHLHDPVNPTPAELQTFEVILYDPQYYPTETGDGEILFQYMDITNDDVWHNYATVGIEDYDHTIGLEYTYANIYPDAAATLANGRAIKFTTDPPDTFTAVGELEKNPAMNYLLAIHPNPFSQIIDIRYEIPCGEHQRPELKIYDISGRLVKSFQLPTSHLLSSNSVNWNGTDNAGKKVPKGIYFVRLQTNSQSMTKKVILVD